MNKLSQLNYLVTQCGNDVFAEYADDIFFIYTRSSNIRRSSTFKKVCRWLEENSDYWEKSQFDARYWVDDFEVLITDDQDLWI